MISKHFTRGFVIASLFVGAISGCESSPTTVKQDPNEQGIQTSKVNSDDFRSASIEITQKMLSVPSFQRALANKTDNGKLPLLVLDRVDNKTTAKMDVNNWFVLPIKETLVNSGKVTFRTSSKMARDLGGMNEILNGAEPRIPDFVLVGTVLQDSVFSGDKKQTDYLFELRLVDATGEEIFVGSSRARKLTSR